MINSIIVTNHLDESIELELRFPEKSGFLVQEITGLGPSKANINSTELATIDGSIYNSARLNSRNIVMTLKLMANPTVETMRHLSYKYFPVKKRIRLIIESDNRTSEIYGYVESNDPNIFSNQESTQISIICPDPYFYSTGEDGTTISVLAGIEPLFEFPFAIEEDGMVIGEVIAARSQNLVYSGDAEIGVMIYIHAYGAVTNLIIYNLTTQQFILIDDTKLTALLGSGITSGDDITISTIKGRKSITLLRNGVNYNILNCLGASSSWFQLAEGDNVFAYNADTGRSSVQFTIENQTVYEGV